MCKKRARGKENEKKLDRNQFIFRFYRVLCELTRVSESDENATHNRRCADWLLRFFSFLYWILKNPIVLDAVSFNAFECIQVAEQLQSNTVNSNAKHSKTNFSKRILQVPPIFFTSLNGKKLIEFNFQNDWSSTASAIYSFVYVSHICETVGSFDVQFACICALQIKHIEMKS